MRDDRRERERYARASIAEQLGGELGSLRRSPALIALLLAILGGWLILTISEPQVVRLGAIRVGDCLYVKAADRGDPAGGRAIGSDAAVVTALFEDGAERAACDASHSHEVADAWTLEESLVAAYPGASTLEQEVQARCTRAFAAYVGRPAEGSSLALTVAVPWQAMWDAGSRSAACLVANADGSFLSGPAKGSHR